MIGTILCNTCNLVFGTLAKDEITQDDANSVAFNECDNGHQNAVIQLEDDTILEPE